MYAWDSTQHLDSQAQYQAAGSGPTAHDGRLPHPAPTDTYNGQTGLEIVSQSPLKAQTAGHAPASDELESCLDGFTTRLMVVGESITESQLKGAFRQCLPSAPLVWKYYVAVLQHLLQLRRDPTPILQVLLAKRGHLLRVKNPFSSIDDCMIFMDCLDQIVETEAILARKVAMVHGIHRILAQLAAQADRSTTDTHDSVVLRLLQSIGCRASYEQLEKPNSTTNLLYTLAANLRMSAENDLLLLHFSKPKLVKGIIVSSVCSVARAPDRSASAQRALYYMPRQQLLALVPEITLRFANALRGKLNSADLSRSRRMDAWLQMLQHVDGKNDMDNALLTAATIPLAEALSACDSPAMIPPEYALKTMLMQQKLDVQVPSTTDTKCQFQALLADVLLRLQTRPKAYSALLDTALPLIARYAGLSLLLRCIRTMEEHKLPLSTSINFEALIEAHLGALHESTEDLSESQLQSRAFTLQACERLINVLDRMGHALPAKKEEVAVLTGTRHFDNILIYAEASSALPIAYRDATKEFSLMDRVAMVHQLAHYYSQDTTRTQRQVWRSIYYLYHYLHTNSLPIGPLLTKAIVHASIVRPLTESRFVSARRLIWVCHLVARVEGDEVAARLENRFFTWRGDLIARAKRVYIGVGGSKQSKAHVATMKRLGLI